MIPTDRFARLETQEQDVLQPDCPVYVHCTRRSVDRASGAVFLQVRMVNCSERRIGTVYLRVEGMDFGGRVCYTVRELPLADCAAAPHAVFGEERMLVLPRKEAATLRVTVERVIFEDGGLWRRCPGQMLVTPQEAGWRRCACSMPNPPQRERCLLCGQPLAAEECEMLPADSGQMQTQEERPAPIMRDFIPYSPDALYEEEPSERSAPRILVVLLCIFGIAAVLSAIAFLTFCLLRFFG